MKITLKILAVLLVICQMAICFSSCGRIFSLLLEKYETDTESEQITETEIKTDTETETETETESEIEAETETEKETETESESEVEFVLNKKALADYVIVIPSDTEEDMTSAAELLQRMIEKDIGVALDIRKDTEPQVEYEIFVGPVDRSVAQEFYKNVRHYDSGYARVGKNILIVGYLEARVEDIVLSFYTFVLRTAGASDTILEDGDAQIYSDDEKNDLYDWLERSKDRYYNPVLEGLTINAMGDSYFEGAGLASEYVWLGLLASKYDINMKNYGKGGSTVTNYITTNNPMCERYDKMANNNPDIVLVEGGRNDFSKGAKPGEVDSYDTTTFAGALNVILEGLKEKYPNAMIVCISNWNFPDKSDYEYTCFDFADAMEAVAERQGVYYIRACDPDVSGIDMRSKSFRTTYCIKDTDVSHLNEAGMKLAMTKFEPILARYYEDFLEKNKTK